MLEGMDEMALAAESRVGCDVGHGGGGVFQRLSSPVKAESQGVFCRSFAEGLPEQSAEMRHGEAGEFCEFIKGCSHSIVLDDAVECGLEAVARWRYAVFLDGIESAHGSIILPFRS